ncbi:MAG: alcohol dehydrogenase catalytic domain-containing protein [Planctomycetota bacterium]
MRALVIDQAGPRLERDRADPVGPTGQAVVRVLCSGLGGLDLAAVAGRIDHAGVLGHEIVGRVESSPKPAQIGAVVAVAPEVACGACDMCRAGMAPHCRTIRVLGFGGTDGGLADRVAVPARNLHVLPAGVGPESAVLAQPVADAVHVARLVPIERQTYVTVLGDGLNALLVAQILARRNASVRLLGGRPERFGLCERWRVRHRNVHEAGLREDQDVVVACFEPDGAMVDESLQAADLTRIALGMLRPRGTLVVAGPPVPVQGVGLDFTAGAEAIVARELRVVGARRGLMADGLAAIAAGDVDLDPLITARADLADGVSALRAAASPEQLRTIIRVAA